MKSRNSLSFGILLVACACFMIVLGVLDSVLDLKISLIRVVFALLLLVCAVRGFIKKRFFAGFMSLCFAFFTVERDIAALCGIESGNIAPNFLVWLAAILLAVGTAIISNGLKFRKFFGDFNTGNSFGKGGFGSFSKYVSASALDGYKISNNAGFSDITVTDEEKYDGNATVYINGNSGNITLRVPPSWRIVINDADPADMANISIRPQNGMPGKMMYLSVKNNSGNIVII